MIKQGSWLTESHMRFDSDKNEYGAKDKSDRIKKERKNKHKIIRDALDD